MAKKKSSLGKMSGVMGAAVRKQVSNSRAVAAADGGPGQTRSESGSSKGSRNVANTRGNNRPTGRKPAV